MKPKTNKLAVALAALKKLQDKGQKVFKGSDFKRDQREILQANGFLKELLKGWYIFSPLNDNAGETTTWNATWKAFVTAYCNERFKKDWHLSPEQSLLIHARSTKAPKQIVIHTKAGSNNTVVLENHVSILDYKSPTFNSNKIVIADGVHVLNPEAALIQASDTFFKTYSVDAQIVLGTISDVSTLIVNLISEGRTIIAGRIAGALRAIGKSAEADFIVHSMKLAGYTVLQTNPFEATDVQLVTSRQERPFERRLRLMWASMREDVLAVFPRELGLPQAPEDYLKKVQEKYSLDAYHSLSIEGYQVSEELINKIAAGAWKPHTDQNTKDAFAAKGYQLAFDAVKNSVKRILNGENAADVLKNDHQKWYLELFGPSITAGIVETKHLSGYRNAPVYIRESLHVPPAGDDARNGMYAYFELLKEEPSAAVRAVLGHFAFVFIHPYMDGNGRMGRFLMNALLASGGYPWTIIPVDRRQEYLGALESASVNQDIGPFASFVADCMGDLS